MPFAVDALGDVRQRLQEFRAWVDAGMHPLVAQSIHRQLDALGLTSPQCEPTTDPDVSACADWPAPRG